MQIDKAMGQSDVGDVGTPHLVGTIHLQALQQVGIHLMSLSCQAGVGFGGDRLYAHLSHQALYPFTVNRVPLPSLISDHFTAAVEWVTGIFLIHQVHEQQVEIPFLSRLRLTKSVVARTIEVQSLALTSDTQIGVFCFDHLTFLLPG